MSGPSSVNEGSTGTYTATATWSDSSTTSVTPTWSVSPTTYASISASGVLTAATVTATQSATVTASYTSGGVTKTATQSVSIVNVSCDGASRTQEYGYLRSDVVRVCADCVCTVCVRAGRVFGDLAHKVGSRNDKSGQYSDRSRAHRPLHGILDRRPGALRRVVASTGFVDFRHGPGFRSVRYQMSKNQVIYLTVRAILDTGDESSLAPGLIWRVENEGPVAPAKGKIIKK